MTSGLTTSACYYSASVCKVSRILDGVFNEFFMCLSWKRQTWQKTPTSDLGDMDLIVWTWKNAKVMDLQPEH